MPAKDKKMPPHLLAREQLLIKMAKLTAVGNSCLPPERELCEEIGLSLGTVKKALKGLVSEGRVLCVPRKGNFISAFAPTPNIGIVVGSGVAAPVTFLRSPEVMRGILEVLEGYNCCVRLIQLRKPETAPQIFKLYQIAACVWYMPDPSIFTRISEAMELSSIPIAVNFLTYKKSDESMFPRNSFYFDFREIGKARAAHLLAAGHTKIVFCGDCGSHSHEGHNLALAGAGIKMNPKWDIQKIEDIPDKLSKILNSNEVTAIVSHGGINRLDMLFRTLERHPNGDKVQLMVDYIGLPLKDLMANHPKVKVAWISHSMDVDTGQAAAKAIVKALQYGVPMHSESFTSKIFTTDEFFTHQTKGQ